MNFYRSAKIISLVAAMALNSACHADSGLLKKLYEGAKHFVSNSIDYIYGSDTSGNKGEFSKPDKANLTFELMKAIKVGDNAKVQNLIALGVDVNKSYAFEEATLAPLVVAILKEEFEIVRCLVEHGANVNDEYNFAGTRTAPIVAAVHQNNVVIVQYLLEHGANVNAVRKFNHSDNATILHDAVITGNMQMVQCLVEHGADVNVQFTYEERPCTVLYLAIFRGKLAMVSYLVEHGAEINSRSKGDSPLDIAIRINDIAMVECLVEHGADINAQNEYGDAALDIAMNEEIKAYLISKGAKS